MSSMYRRAVITIPKISLRMLAFDRAGAMRAS
jgi:hypothetical protein